MDILPDSNNVLGDLFGDNRAEWSPERFRELFVAPTYLRKLESRRPSILIGGRGTGKTTTLKSLRFDATFERLLTEGQTFGDQAHLGVFIRINKNHVTAFCGSGLDQETWSKAFAHYFNLLACAELCHLCAWLEAKVDRVLPAEKIEDIATGLAVSGNVSTILELRRQIECAITALQLFVNNPKNAHRPLFSIAEAPLVAFANHLNDERLTEGRVIFCCVDEYENLLDEQQAILNTYIKHAQPPLSYKIGVRQGGHRTLRTIDAADLLAFPDDYRPIEIAEEGFEQFAAEVANRRLRRAKQRGISVPETLNDFLEEMPFSKEAVQLGADTIAAQVLKELESDPALHQVFSARPSHETYFLKYWSESEDESVFALAKDWLSNDEQWVNRLNNYGYASLFWLSKGRKGARIRKYYSGARTFVALSGGNIRYFLELIDAAISGEEAFTVQDGLIRITAKAQTIGARTVGQRRLNQLEGLSQRGMELKRLILAVGKVFFELARTPLGRTPEVTSFVLSGDDVSAGSVAQLIQEGVAHLALEATPRTKATTQFEMRDDEYRLHPIFCAFFEISHRRKRRTTFAYEELWRSANGSQPGKAISKLLGSAIQSPSEDLPDQLALFTTFFDAGTGT